MFYRKLCWILLCVSSTIANAHGQPIKCVGDAEFLTSVALSPDAKLVVAGGDGHTATVWDATSGTKLRELPVYRPGNNNHGITALSFLPDGNIVAIGAGLQPITFWNAKTGGNGPVNSIQTECTNGLSISADGSRLAVAECQQVNLWNLKTSQELKILPVDKLEIARALAVAISPDGSLLAAGLQDKDNYPLSKIPKVYVWQLPSGKEIFNTWSYHGPPKSVAFSPDGKLLATVGENGGVLEIWNVKTKQRVHAIAADKVGLFCVAFNPDGKTIATGGNDHDIKIWEVEDGHLFGLLKGHTDQVKDLSFSRDGRTLASSGRDKTVLIWNLDSDVTKPTN